MEKYAIMAQNVKNKIPYAYQVYANSEEDARKRFLKQYPHIEYKILSIVKL